MKSFWNRSTCRVHVFTRLCFRLWILGIQKQQLKRPIVAVEPAGTGDGGDLRQVGCICHVPALPLVQPLVEEGAENVDSLRVFLF